MSGPGTGAGAPATSIGLDSTFFHHSQLLAYTMVAVSLSLGLFH